MSQTIKGLFALALGLCLCLLTATFACGEAAMPTQPEACPQLCSRAHEGQECTCGQQKAPADSPVALTVNPTRHVPPIDAGCVLLCTGILSASLLLLLVSWYRAP